MNNNVVNSFSIAESFTTILVKRSTKKLLECEKGHLSWDEFLLSLLRSKKLQERKKALKRIKKRLAKSERFVVESTNDLRRGLKLKELFYIRTMS